MSVKAFAWGFVVGVAFLLLTIDSLEAHIIATPVVACIPMFVGAVTALGVAFAIDSGGRNMPFTKRVENHVCLRKPTAKEMAREGLTFGTEWTCPDCNTVYRWAVDDRPGSVPKWIVVRTGMTSQL
jgi:hypothetical protein